MRRKCEMESLKMQCGAGQSPKLCTLIDHLSIGPAILGRPVHVPAELDKFGLPQMLISQCPSILTI
jgi:hypothetical protein